RSLDPGADGQLFAQVNGVVSALAGLLQGLGFHELVPEVGEPFDPATMECVGYAPGRPGVVLAGVHPGYRAHDVIVRPAGVLIADPTRIGEEGNDETPDIEPEIEREEP
ncbi:MAG TPA: nucleotide exchange factor GrpE, partial [Thermoanaerobaculia bacterium]